MKRNFWTGAVTLTVFGLAVAYSSAVRQAVLAAGERCLTVLIPSLYVYSLLGAFLIRSGGLAAIGRRMGERGMLLVTALFSQLGGYPVGAQLLAEMRRTGQITPAQERALLCVCVGCGPGFLFGTVCRGMPPGESLWLLLSVSLPNLLGFALLPVRGEGEVSTVSAPLVESLNAAADSAANAMLKITAMVLGFAGMMGICEGIGVTAGLPLRWRAGIRAVCEVSCLTEAMGCGLPLPLAAALLSFGGICVHLQIAAICRGNLPWVQFYLVRLLCAALTCGICRAGMLLVPDAAVMTALTGEPTALTTGSIAPGLCLLLMAVMTLRQAEHPREPA